MYGRHQTLYEILAQSIQSIKSIKQFLGGLSSGTTARSTGDSQLVSSMWSGKDFLNRCVLRRRRNVVNDSADVTSSGRSFHVYGPATGKARLPTVESLLVGTTKPLLPTERSDRRLGRSATRVKGPRYPGRTRRQTMKSWNPT